MLPQFAHKTIPALNGIRAIAVALVMLYHFGLRVPGGHGVLIFFVLSGFLITWLLLKEDDVSGAVSLKGFYSRRVLRIFPAFYVFLGLGLIALVATHRHIFWSQMIATILYGANYYQALHPETEYNAIFAHLWSLAVEEQFYFAWPLIFLGLRKNRRRMAIVLAVAISIIWIYRALLVRAGVSDRYIYHAFETRVDHLLVGCLAAVLLRSDLLPAFWRTITRSVWMPLVPVALFACSASYGMNDGRYRDAIGYMVDPILAAAFIVQLVSLSASSLWRWLDHPVISWMGRISYSLYLYQQVGMSRLHGLAGRPVALQFAVCIAATFALASMSHYIVEKPFIRLKQRFSKSGFL
jgi:peptidoglycan/LPS O-acetylase OafA/YrhL